jgi:hypothetical protein
MAVPGDAGWQGKGVNPRSSVMNCEAGYVNPDEEIRDEHG